MNADPHILINGRTAMRVAPGCVVRLGRSTRREVVGLDPTDPGIAHVVGSVRETANLCIIQNESPVALLIEPEAGGHLHPLSPGHQYIVNHHTVLIVRGHRRRHSIDIYAHGAESRFANTQNGVHRLMAPIALTEGERDALAAVFRGFLETFPRRECTPLSYQEAGSLLGIPPSTVRKRLEKVRSKLADAGIIIDGQHARWILAEEVISARLLTVEDLKRLKRN